MSQVGQIRCDSGLGMWHSDPQGLLRAELEEGPVGPAGALAKPVAPHRPRADHADADKEASGVSDTPAARPGTGLDKGPSADAD